MTRQGVPLTKKMLTEMTVEERVCLVGFLKQARSIAKKLEKDGVILPYLPSDNLQEKYELVISNGGQKYCQVKRFQNIFTFESFELRN